jgi:hypothetical protein
MNNLNFEVMDRYFLNIFGETLGGFSGRILGFFHFLLGTNFLESNRHSHAP